MQIKLSKSVGTIQRFKKGGEFKFFMGGKEYTIEQAQEYADAILTLIEMTKESQS